MKAVFLGTGTSTGVPLIGCDCAVCKSDDPRNRRRRTSLYVEAGSTHVVVDTPPDFREQVLAYGIRRVDAVLFTHSHADHVFGFDDIRRFNMIQDGVIPAYGSEQTVADLRRIFAYVDERPNVAGLFTPRIEFRIVGAPFEIGDLSIDPLPVVHAATAETLGFLFRAGGCSLAYIPDCAEMPESVKEAVAGADVMILDALRYRPHATHLTVEHSLALLEDVGAPKSYIVHLSHDLDHGPTQAAMPPNVYVSYDGLTLDWQGGGP